MRVRSALHSLRRFVFDPGTFFERRTNPPDLGGAFAVVLAVAAVSTAAFAVMGWVFASNIDATVTVTTMEPWPDSTCESFADMNHTPPPCTIDEPRTKQVDVGEKVWGVFVGKLPVVFFGTLLGWVLVAAALHATSALVGGEGSFTETLTVAGYGTVPALVQTLFGLVGFTLLVQGMDFSSDPAVLADQLQDLAGGLQGGLSVVGALAATAWQAYLWTHGLRHGRSLDVGSAGVAAGVVAVVSFLFAVA